MLNVVEEVSKFVAKKVGLSLEEFAAVLRNPNQISNSKLVEQVQPFAMVTAQILRRLGGEYLKVADEIQLLFPQGKLIDDSKVFLDDFYFIPQENVLPGGLPLSSSSVHR